MITHQDLTLQYAIPQTMHAALEFGIAFPDEYQKWHSRSNSIITLATKNERTLWEFSKLLDKKGLRYVSFHEPDVGMALTALAIVPNPLVKRVCMGIPLCGKYVNPLAQSDLGKHGVWWKPCKTATKPRD